MARARNIKPGFFKNEDLIELDFEYRLLFIGLWTLADRDGKLEDRPKRIKMEVFPADNVDVEKGLSELECHGFIERYEVNGKRLVLISKFTVHQSPHHTEKSSELPNKDGSLTVKEPKKKENKKCDSPLDNGGETGESPKQDGGNPPDSLIHRFTDSPNKNPLSGEPDPVPPKPSPHSTEADDAIEYLNSKTGAHYRKVEANLRLVRARLAEGATLDEIKAVIDSKAQEWAGTDSAKYLRPETLFNATKYNQYAGQVGGMRHAAQKPRGLVL